MALMTSIDFKFLAFNCNGLKSNTAYINQLIANHDILFLSELWIQESEKHLIHNYRKDFNIIFTPGKRGAIGRPYGGNILLIRKSLQIKSELILQEEFTTIMKLDFENLSLLLVGVYLQSITKFNDCINIYQNQLDTINGTLKHFEESCETIIMGDFQCCPEYTQYQRSMTSNQLSPSY